MLVFCYCSQSLSLPLGDWTSRGTKGRITESTDGNSLLTSLDLQGSQVGSLHPGSTSEYPLLGAPPAFRGIGAAHSEKSEEAGFFLTPEGSREESSTFGPLPTGFLVNSQHLAEEKEMEGNTAGEQHSCVSRGRGVLAHDRENYHGLKMVLSIGS